MSGLEVVGIVASILQIADLGAKISVKLCSFYHTVKDANQSMQSLSSDVSLTCSILQQLGKVLEKDEKTKICSQQAFHTAQDVLGECKTVFEGINNAMEKQKQEGARGTFLRGARKLTVAFMGPNLDLLKSNLERLKSTMLLMLHVIMYAEQLRRRDEKTPTDNQRDLLATLLEEKKANDTRFSQLAKSIEAVNLHSPMQTLAVKDSKSTIDPSQELEKYYGLVSKLLREIDLCKDSLENSRHHRIRIGVVNVHSMEAAILRHTHGDIPINLWEESLECRLNSKSQIPVEINTKQGAGNVQDHGITCPSTWRPNKVVMQDEPAQDAVATITIVVKTSTAREWTMTLPLSTLVSELKMKLETTEPDKSESSDEFKIVPADRQRLIYSGRFLKDRETLGSYKIKDAHTLHMVGNASSNQRSMAVATSAEKMANYFLNEYLSQWTTLSDDEIHME
ncbi:unnamed protein product [Penicillium pancosmium]